MTKFVMTNLVIMDTLAGKLKQLRIYNRLKINDLALKMGISPTLISRYESEQRLPSASHIEAYESTFKDPIIRQLWLAEQVADIIKEYDNVHTVLQWAESRVEYLRSQYGYNIKKLSKNIQSQIDKLQELHTKWIKNKPLNSTQLKKLQEYFQVRYTFESNKMEGNTLTHQETAIIALEGITISGKSMREHLEVMNHQHAIQFLIDLVNDKTEFNKRTLLQLHQLILKSIDPPNAGIFRSVPVRISGTDVELPQPYLLDQLMEDYFKFYDLYKMRLHPVILAAELHERLVSIHPFIDGNGRTARLVMNYILLKHHFPIVSLKADTTSRLAYYKSLQAVQKDNKPERFYAFIIKAVGRALYDHIEML